MRRIFLVVVSLAPGFYLRAADDLNTTAEKYAHLVLALGQHDQE